MNYVNGKDLKEIVKNALREDIGKRDITTESIVQPKKYIKAIILAKQDLVICGLAVASLAFRTKDKNIKFTPLVREGALVKKNRVIARIYGNARSILTAERVALNFLTLLSGISTTTRAFVDALKPYKAKIADTRKTIPGLRILEKYAVRIGGGYNHRMSLDEMVLVKDNHLAASCVVRRASCVREVLQIAKRKQKNIKIEIEVKNLREFKEALKEKPDIIMLDNTNLNDINEAVKIRNTQYAIHKTLLEASGGITLKNVREIASTGVDIISVGALTHSINSVDISLEIL
jgi:nicotinate-nucleotide pyrophosphorylase (carboxylating)